MLKWRQLFLFCSNNNHPLSALRHSEISCRQKFVNHVITKFFKILNDRFYSFSIIHGKQTPYIFRHKERWIGSFNNLGHAFIKIPTLTIKTHALTSMTKILARETT